MDIKGFRTVTASGAQCVPELAAPAQQFRFVKYPKEMTKNVQHLYNRVSWKKPKFPAMGEVDSDSFME